MSFSVPSLRGFIGVNSTYNPAYISNLVFRWDASSPTSLYDSNVGGNLVTTDNSAIGRIEPLVGSLYMSQATTTLRPVLKTNSVNGLNSIQFDNVDDILGGNTSVGNQSNSTFFLVGSFYTPSVSTWGFYGTTSRLWFGFGGTVTGASKKFGFPEQTLPGASNSFYASNYTFDESVNLHTQIRQNQNIYIPVIGNKFYRINGQDQSFVRVAGSTDDWGYPFTAATPSLGKSCKNFCEVLIYNRKLSDSEIVYIENGLMEKWGITSASPVSIPVPDISNLGMTCQWVVGSATVSTANSNLKMVFAVDNPLPTTGDIQINCTGALFTCSIEDQDATCTGLSPLTTLYGNGTSTIYSRTYDPTIDSYSSATSINLSKYSCPGGLSAPVISNPPSCPLGGNVQPAGCSEVVNFTITSSECGITYIVYGEGDGSSDTPSDSNYDASFSTCDGSITVSVTGANTSAPSYSPNPVYCKAITINSDCSLQSSVSSVTYGYYYI